MNIPYDVFNLKLPAKISLFLLAASFFTIISLFQGTRAQKERGGREKIGERTGEGKLI